MKKFSYIKNFKLFGIISAALCTLALIGVILSMFGIPIYTKEIDYTGGVLMEIELGTPVTQEMKNQIIDICKDVSGVTPIVTKFENSETGVFIKAGEMSGEVRQQVFTKIAEQYGNDKVILLDTKYISTSASKNIKHSVSDSLAIACFLILIYISIRFNLKSGFVAIICSIQNILIMLLSYAIFRIPISMAFISSLLIIIAYSIITSILVFDSIRQNKKLQDMTNYTSNLIDLSITKTIGRIVSTSVIALLPVVMFFLIGSGPVKSFAVPLIFGIIAGIYSSIFLAGSLLNVFNNFGVYKK